MGLSVSRSYQRAGPCERVPSILYGVQGASRSRYPVGAERPLENQMALDSGTILGSYRILGPIGAGAMGEVYRARDTRLGRDVAIKVLPEHFAGDDERLKRFEREARSLASLNHPNIAQIHGVDQVGDTRFLVLELVEGESIEDRLTRGPLPMDEALDVARQIALGLEAAHEAGVIHRDSKPANVRLTPDGRVKVLDFGLAKPARGGSGEPGSSSTNDSVFSTEAGRLLGTPTYMAPEQARDRPIDRRVDIWALGCVLYECLSGRRAFDGETLSDVLAAVLEKEPDWSRLPASTPPRVRELIERCLTKDPRERLRDAGDARLEISRAARGDDAPPGVVAAQPRSLHAAACFAAGAILAGAAVWLASMPAPARPAPVTRFALTGIGLPIDAFQGLALSPDGRRLVYRARGEDGRERLHLRSFGSSAVRVLPDTEGGFLPFFSPDGERVGFFALGVLKIVAVSSGISSTIADLPQGFSGAAWLPDDTIVFAGASSRRLGRVAASGGETVYIDIHGTNEGDIVTSPSALPGGSAILCASSNGATFDVAVIDLASRTSTVIAENGFTPTFSVSGHVVYQQGSSGPLMALPFDPDQRESAGPAFPVVTDVGSRVSYQVRMFALASDGTLAYVPRSALLDSGALVWMDRHGQSTPIAEIGRIIDMPRVSGDGKRIAFRTPAPSCDIWVHDLDRGVTARVTHEGDSHGICWSPDDTRLAFARLEKPPGWTVFEAAADGSGRLEPLSPPTLQHAFVSSYSTDGKYILVGTSPESGSDVALVETMDRSTRPLLHSRFEERAAVFSPDGRRIAYVSDESGREEVYVQPFPALDARVKISTDGGADPVWSRDGKELFFRWDRKMMAVDVDAEPVFSARRPRVLFDCEFSSKGSSGLASYDVSADGERFVMVRERSGSSGAEVNIVLNWHEEVRELAPKSGRE